MLYMCRPVYLSTCLPADQHICKSMCFTKISMCRPVYLSTCLPVYLSTCLPADLVHVECCICKTFNVSICLPVHLSICLPADHVHVEICIYKTFNVPICLPVHLSTCPPCRCKSKNMYLQQATFHVPICLHVDQRRIFVFKYLKKIVRLSCNILAPKCVGNSKVVPYFFSIKPNKITFVHLYTG